MSKVTTNTLKAPVIGDSVFVGFVTNGDGKMIKGGALHPFDKVDAVYSDTSKDKRGNTLHTVRLASGDMVSVTGTGKNYWQAVA